MKIIFGFSTKKRNPISAIIRKFDHTDFSHCYVRIKSSLTSEMIVYEASNLYVSPFKLKNFKKHNDIICEFEIDVNEVDFLLIANYIEDNLGTPFGILSMIGIAISKLFNLRKNIFADNGKSLFCSEFVDQILYFIGEESGKQDMVTPKDIYEIVKGLKNVVSIH